MNAEPSFFSRVALAYVVFFRVLFQAAFATRVQRLAAGAADAERPARSERAEPAAELPVSAVELPVAAVAPVPVSPVPAPEQTVGPALSLLSLLQLEARLIDFTEQDIDGFSDADVGSAARLVHAGCRKVLRSRGTVQALHPEAEGARVRVDAGFNADEIKLIGNVGAKPPYSGVLRHRGWKITGLTLPQLRADGLVLAQAEVEL